MTEEEIRALISIERMTVIRGQILELSGSIKTAMIKYFDGHYATLSEATVSAATMTIAVDGVCGERVFQYRDFDNTKAQFSIGFKI